jgi:hypothetical protein
MRNSFIMQFNQFKKDYSDFIKNSWERLESYPMLDMITYDKFERFIYNVMLDKQK